MWCSARRPRTSGRSARLGTEATAVGEELVQGVDVDVLRVRVRGEHVGHELPLAIDRVLLHLPAELRNRFPARTTALKRKHARADHCARYTFEAPQVPGDARISSSVRSIFVSVSSAAMRAAGWHVVQICAVKPAGTMRTFPSLIARRRSVKIRHVGTIMARRKRLTFPSHRKARCAAVWSECQ